MPVKTACTKCGAPYTLADSLRGKPVRCKRCLAVFPAREADSAAPAAEPVEGGVIAAPPPLPGGARRVRPVPPEDAPPPRRRPGRDEPRGSAAPWIIAATVGGVLLAAGLVVTILLIARAESEPDPPPPIVLNMPNPGDFHPQMPPFQIPPGEMPPFQPPPQIDPAGQAPALFKASSVRFPINARDNKIKDISFAPLAKRVGVFYADSQNFFKEWFDLHDEAGGGRVAHVDVSAVKNGRFLDLSPDGKRVALQDGTAGRGYPLTVWSLPDGNVLFDKWDPYPKDPNPGKNVNRELVFFAFLDADRLLTVARNGQYDLWDMAQKRNVYSVPVGPGRDRSLNLDFFSRRPSNLAVSRDRRVLALSNRDGFDLIDTATGQPLRSTESLAAGGRVGNEWSVSFSPDGGQLAAKLNLFLNNRQHEQVVVWDVATGRKKAQFVTPQDFNANGPLVWWGAKHVVLSDGNLFEGRVMSLADGRILRIGQRHAFGKFAGASPDGRVWYATGRANGGPAEMAAVDAPEDALAQPENAPGGGVPRWYFRPEGISTQPGRGF